MEKKTVKDHLENLKTTFEGLNVQLHLGKADLFAAPGDHEAP